MRQQAQNSMKKILRHRWALFEPPYLFFHNFRSFITTDEVFIVIAIGLVFWVAFTQVQSPLYSRHSYFSKIQTWSSYHCVGKPLQAPCGLGLGLSFEAWYLMLFTIWRGLIVQCHFLPQSHLPMYPGLQIVCFLIKSVCSLMSFLFPVLKNAFFFCPFRLPFFPSSLPPPLFLSVLLLSFFSTYLKYRLLFKAFPDPLR